MMDVDKMVRSQLIPLQDMSLVLPNTCIAEVLSFSQPQSLPQSPDWLLGLMAWRGMSIPVISFQHLAGTENGEMDNFTQIIVLNGLTENSDLPFYGIAIQGIPRLMTLNSTNINTITRPEKPVSLALEQTMIGDQLALIPDLPQLEAILTEHQLKTLQIIGIP